MRREGVPADDRTHRKVLDGIIRKMNRISRSRRNPVVTSGAYVVPDNDITSRAASMG